MNSAERKEFFRKRRRRRDAVIRGPDETHIRIGERKYRAVMRRGMNYKHADGDYRPVHLDLDASDGDGIGVDAAGVRTRFPLTIDRPFVSRDRKTGRVIRFRYVDASSAAVERVGKRTIAYRDALPLSDIIVRATNNGPKAFWRFREPGHPTSIRVDVFGLDDAVRSVEDGAVVYRVGEDVVARFAPVVLTTPTETPPREATPVLAGGRRIRWVLPDTTDLSYPFVFDPTLNVSPAAGSGSTTVDGNVSRSASNETLSDISNGAGTGVSTVLSVIRVGLSGDATTNRYDLCRRAILTFDTSSIPDSNVVTSATLRLYCDSADPDLGGLEIAVVGATPAADDSLVAADYGNVQSTRFDTVAIRSDTVTAPGWNEFPFNSFGIAAIESDGVTGIGVRYLADLDGNDGLVTWANATEQVTFRSADNSNSPELVVEYEDAPAPDPDPVPGSSPADVEDGAVIRSSVTGYVPQPLPARLGNEFRRKIEVNIQDISVLIDRLAERVDDLATTSASSSAPVFFMAGITTDVVLTAATGSNPPLPSATVEWNDAQITGTGFTNSSGEITVGADLDGMTAVFNAHVLGDGFDNRTQVVMELEVDTGGGFSTIARSSNYNSRDGDQNEGATQISGFVRALAAGEVYRVRVGNNSDGSVGVMSASGTYFSVQAF